MSVTVPTASGTESSGPTSPDDTGGPARGWVVLLVVAMVAVGLWDRDPPARESLPDEVAPPSVTFSEARELALDVAPALHSETFFPGDGTFTAHAGSIHGQVAVGQRSRRPGAFVYTTDPAGETWTPGSIEVAERAWVGDVSPWMHTFVIGGAIAGPGMGSSVPTLWSGTSAGEFRVLEHPFAGPGRVDRLRVVHGDLYLIGQGAAPFTDTLAVGSARFGRLLVGRPGAWSDITPDGFNVIVNDVVGYGDGVVAVGGDADGAVLWWLAAGSDEWVTIDLGDGVATGATMTSTAGLVTSVLTASPEGETLSVLLAGTAPDGLTALGSPIRAAIGNIQPYDGGVLGTSVPGGEASLWWYRPGCCWATIRLGAVVGMDRAVFDAASSPGLVAFGTAGGQPVLWSGGPVEPQVLDDATFAQWVFVSLLPGRATQVLDIGTHLFAYRNTLDAETVWVSSGGPWHPIETVDGFGLAGASGNEDGWAMFGETDSYGVVYHAEGTDEPDVVLLPGVSVRYATRTLDRLVVLGTEAGVPYRIEIRSGQEPVRHELDRLPARVIAAGPVLAGADFDGGGVAISADNGSTWLLLPGSDKLIGWADNRVLASSTEPDRILEYYPATGAMGHLQGGVEGSDIVAWGDGAAQVAGEGVIVYNQPEARQVLVDVESGKTAVFQSLIAGPNRLALVTESGVSAIYRWTDPS